MSAYNLFFVTELPEGLTAPVQVVECGCCSAFHRLDYDGDCRNDNERFWDLEEAEQRLGLPVIEVF